MKVAICLPIHHSGAKPAFVRCLGRMIVRTCAAAAAGGLELEVFESSGMISDARTRLTRLALNWGADYLLWLDSDQTFPPETLLRLLSLKLDVVGANIPTRVEPIRPTAIAKKDGADVPLWTTPELAGAQAVEEVESLGLGLALVSAEAFAALDRHAKDQGRRSYWPLFAMEWGEDGQISLGEDKFFFRKLREAGVKVHVDHAVSGATAHIGERVLTHGHVVQEVPVQRVAGSANDATLKSAN